jgi:hypothetical protein
MDTMQDIKTIYESPDGGKTVYARQMGSDKRRIIMTDDSENWRYYLRYKDWDELAKENPAILETLEKLKVLETLCST